jgi:hypothetical protein
MCNPEKAGQTQIFGGSRAPMFRGDDVVDFKR